MIVWKNLRTWSNAFRFSDTCENSEQWRQECNSFRPLHSLQKLTPNEIVAVATVELYYA